MWICGLVKHHSQVRSRVSCHVVLGVRLVAGYDHLQKVSVGIGPVLISVSVRAAVISSTAPWSPGQRSHHICHMVSMSLMLVYSANAGQDFVILGDSDSQVWLGNDFYCPRWCIAEQRVARHHQQQPIFCNQLSVGWWLVAGDLCWRGKCPGRAGLGTGLANDTNHRNNTACPRSSGDQHVITL